MAWIDEEECSGCRMCNTMCPYNAIEYDEERKISRDRPALCKGCGTCVAACPAGATGALQQRPDFAEIEQDPYEELRRTRMTTMRSDAAIASRPQDP